MSGEAGVSRLPSIIDIARHLDREQTMPMADTLETFRSMLVRPVSLDEAIMPYLGATPLEVDQCAEGRETSNGLLMRRLRDLVVILALREAPPHLAMLAAALLWRSAPVAASVDQLRDAIERIVLWRGGMDKADVARIVAAHRTHSRLYDELTKRLGRSDGAEIEALLEVLTEEARGDDVVVELGVTLMIVEMTDTDYFVGLMDENDVVYVVDRIPHSWRDDPDDDDGRPVAPVPSLLLDA